MEIKAILIILFCGFTLGDVEFLYMCIILIISYNWLLALLVVIVLIVVSVMVVIVVELESKIFCRNEWDSIL